MFNIHLVILTLAVIVGLAAQWWALTDSKNKEGFKWLKGQLFPDPDHSVNPLWVVLTFVIPAAAVVAAGVGLGVLQARRAGVDTGYPPDP